MADDLTQRLELQNNSFNGLLSLLPPDLYYGKSNRDQEWNKKKQTKAEKKAARKAKLNPANHKTAKDVADERDLKRRLEDEEAERAAAGLEGPIERPGEGIALPKPKRQKTAKGQDVHSKAEDKDASKSDATSALESAQSKDERRRAKEQKRKEKKAVKAAKDAKKKAVKKAKSKAASKTTQDEDEEEGENEEDDDEDAGANDDATEDEVDGAEEQEDADGASAHMDDDMGELDVSGLVEEPSQKERTSSSRSASPALEFSPQHNDRSSSTSSIPTPKEVEELRQPSSKPKSVLKKSAAVPEKADSIEAKKTDTPEEVKARKEANLAKLKAIIEEKRAARNADGLNGKPARSRSELIEARRQKEQEKKEKKKELRAQDREAEKKAKLEAHLASLRGSPALGSELFAPRSRSASVSSPGVNANSFSFGRVAFTDGARMNSALSGLAEDSKKSKGPSDAKTALLAAEKHQAHLNGLDASKRADLEEKDIWLNARKRINGEKIRDDISLLKKSLKRKEKAKSKSEREWNERTQGVKKSQEARQKKREENIAKRKEEKGGKGKKGGTGAGVKKRTVKPRKKGF